MSSGETMDGRGIDSYSPPFTAVSVITAILGVAIAAWLFAWAYGPAEHYSPIVQLNFLLAGGMGWLIGKAAQAMIRKKRINRIGPALLLGLAGGLVGLWSSWLTYLWVLGDYDFGFYWECLSSPELLWLIIGHLAENPAWTIGKSSSSDPAIMYYLAWLFEAAIIVGTPVSMCRTFLKENLLCDGCNDWLGATGDVAYFSLAETADNAIVDAVKAGDLSRLVSLPRLVGGGDAPRWLEARGYACPNCKDLDSHVSVSLGVVKQKKGKPEASVKPLIHFVPVATEMERDLFEPPPAETDDSASSPAAGPDRPTGETEAGNRV